MRRKSPTNTLYLVDASIYIFRAWFSLQDSIIDREGNPVNAVYGFGHFLLQLLERAGPSHIAAVFDESLTSSFRNRIYPAYKANREPAPPELKYQFQQCRKLCRAHGIRDLSSKRFEADDLIGTLVSRGYHAGYGSVIVSRDKDLAQLLQGDVRLWDFAEDRWLDRTQAAAHFGVDAAQMADFLALAGDAVDNIPGVPGVGKKTAQCLLREFADLETLYANLDRVDAMGFRGAARTRALLEQHRELAFLSQRLTQIKCDVPIRTDLDDCRWQPQLARMQRYWDGLGLGLGQRLLPRFTKLVAGFDTGT